MVAGTSMMNNQNIQHRLHLLCKRNAIIQDVLDDLASVDATAYLVGGSVRDLIAGVPLTDIDIEVHHITLSQLSEILQKYAEVSYVGKVYGVLKLHDARYRHIDWSIPRRDTAGRKPEVSLDPELDMRQALIRRDLTMNAMALNIHSGTIEDPFGGFQDLQDGILRTPDPDFFTEDPLRFYRVMQFVARFSMWPDQQLQELCAQMDISQVSLERIDGEMEKTLTRSARPSRAFFWLSAVDRLRQVAPELADLQGVPQSSLYHPEGDVFVHTMQALDAGVYSVLPVHTDRLTLMYAILCHDLGKPMATYRTQDGQIKSTGHAEQGVAPARSMLKRLTPRSHIHKAVARIVEHHMLPGVYGRQNTRLSRYKQLAQRLSPDVSLYLLSAVCYADQRGRNGYADTPLADPIAEVDTYISKAREAGVLYEPEARVLTGDDVTDLVPEGPLVGKLLQKAYDIQICEHIHDKKKLKQRAYAWLQKRMKGEHDA